MRGAELKGRQVKLQHLKLFKAGVALIVVYLSNLLHIFHKATIEVKLIKVKMLQGL